MLLNLILKITLVLTFNDKLLQLPANDRSIWVLGVSVLVQRNMRVNLGWDELHNQNFIVCNLDKLHQTLHFLLKDSPGGDLWVGADIIPSYWYKWFDQN